MTPLHILNFYFLQWFFVRLCYEDQRVIEEFQMYEASLLPNGECGIGGRVKKSRQERRYGLHIGAMPMSGYDDRPYRYPFGRPIYRWFTNFKPVKTPRQRVRPLPIPGMWGRAAECLVFLLVFPFVLPIILVVAMYLYIVYGDE